MPSFANSDEEVLATIIKHPLCLIGASDGGAHATVDDAITHGLRLAEEVRLNQTGPVEDFRQPYVDQLVVGVEKQLGRWVKAEAVYVHRANGNMVARNVRNVASVDMVFSASARCFALPFLATACMM